MNYYTGLDNFEINAPKKYYTYAETPNYRVFSDNKNPDAYDANFAVLKTAKDIENTVKQVEIFHQAAGATPLFVSAPDSVSLQEAKAALIPLGYSFCAEQLVVMEAFPKTSYKDIMPVSCKVKALSVLEGAERALNDESSGNAEYSSLMIDRKLAAGAKMFVVYDSQGLPVSECVAESYGEVLVICDVYTRENARRLGFGRAVMCAALKYANEKSYAAVYLYVTKDEAKKLYEKVGFKEKKMILTWKAFKGELPSWILSNVENIDV